MKFSDFLKTVSANSYKLSTPFIIAEAGVNHEGDINIAKRLIDEAKVGGAHAIKFQTYKASTIASKDSPAYWDMTKEPTDSQFKLFQKYDKFGKDEFVILKEYCDQVGIEFMSTPFDIESANYLNNLMNVYKISSSDITNKPFIKHMCSFGKPIILSTGASQIHEIQEAISWIKDYNVPLVLLHCVLNYPTPDANAHLGMIKGLKHHFPDYIIGYSDHTLPHNNMKNVEIAHLLGAMVIEKHFTHDKSLPGNDHYHAMDKEDLKLFFSNLKNTYNLLGSFDVKALEDEKPAIKNARRSLVAKCAIKKGETLSLDNLTFKRPAHGVSPRFIDEVTGSKALVDINEDTVLKWEMFSK